MEVPLRVDCSFCGDLLVASIGISTERPGRFGFFRCPGCGWSSAGVSLGVSLGVPALAVPRA